jgi:Flp pilus assembly protein TadG
MRGWFGIWRDERGATSAEFAMVLIVFFGLIFGTIGLCFAVWAQETLQYATEATARYVAVCSSSCTSAQTFGMNHYAGPNDSPTFSALTVAGCGNGVRGTATFPLDVVFIRKPLSLTATACFP